MTSTTTNLPFLGLDDSWLFDNSNLVDGINTFDFDLPFRTTSFLSTPPPLSTYHSIDPFDTLPVSMPLKSMELFHHMTHFRILTRSLVPKSPNNACIAMTMQDPGLFRGCLLLSAMHYSWIHGGSLGDAEETYLYHKVEAIHLVNEKIGDPASSELCANVIAALALSESGIGDIAAAEAHLNGLFTLINWRKPEEWQGRLHGLFQRLVLVAGTFISASKGVGWQPPRLPCSTEHTPQLHFTRPTTGHFSAAQFDATKLSPFYFATPPDYEAANADLEGMAITNALQRLSSLTPAHIKPMQPHSSPSSTTVGTSPLGTSSDITVGQELTQVVLLETESYLASILFRPDAPPPALTLGHQVYQPPEHLTSMNNTPSRQRQREEEQTPRATRRPAMTMENTIDPLLSFDPNLFVMPDLGSNSIRTSTPSPASSYASVSSSTHSVHSGQSAHSIRAVHTPPQQQSQQSQNVSPIMPPYRGPFDSLSPALVPSSSRAWSAGAYLYLHTFLEDLWLPPKAYSFPVLNEQNLPPPTQSQIDPNLRRWLLDTLCANLERSKEAMLLGAYSRETWIWQVLVGAYVVATTENRGKSTDPKLAPFIDPSLLGGDYFGPSINMPPENYLGAWFREQMRVWADTVDAPHWSDARRNASTIAWPQAGWKGEELIEDLWRRAMARQGSP
ncbi:hypothetical protein SBRCBS47491_000834 [Sporothrix bragantina]|uniref:C6 zinc finger domain containing protein n=1 Tax=Sporothrix bragantina TaxID=671064 RepID=A0ABP0ATR5_9PEZI